MYNVFIKKLKCAIMLKMVFDNTVGENQKDKDWKSEINIILKFASRFLISFMLNNQWAITAFCSNIFLLGQDKYMHILSNVLQTELLWISSKHVTGLYYEGSISHNKSNGFLCIMVFQHTLVTPKRVHPFSYECNGERCKGHGLSDHI